MACVKIGSKNNTFHKQGQSWFSSAGLPSDVLVEVHDTSFNLHKFPLLSKSGVLERLIAEASENEDAKSKIVLPEIPGGSKTFELVAKFCYGVKLELSSSNAVHLRCAAEILEMTEDRCEGNLITHTENFINQVILQSWKDAITALISCEDVLPMAERLQITEKCVASLAAKVSSDQGLFGWPMQSPNGSVLWNGISTSARARPSSSDWWYDDVSSLSFPLYRRLIYSMEAQRVNPETLAGSIASYTKKHLHLKTSEAYQKQFLEEIEALLPPQKHLFSTKFISLLLKTALILRASPSCVSSLEKRLGTHLDEASLEDILIPNFSNSLETLYNIDCVERVLNRFLTDEELRGGASPDEIIGSPELTPVTKVAKLIDTYLAEVAPDVNLKVAKFHALALAVPDYARVLDDALYRAIDVFLKAHPWVGESEREEICRLMDCRKLSLEACTHAAQNERLPLRVVVQVLFFEQVQLRTSIAGCFMVSENLEVARGGVGVRDSEVMRVGMDSMRMRVSELEKECESMRKEIEKLGKPRAGGAWGSVSRRFGFGMKSQICSAEEESVKEKKKEKSGKSKKKLAG